jgi:hypothetical protein
VALLFGMTLPVTPVQILWINLITAITLAWHIVLVAVLFVCGVFGIYAYAVDRGYPVELARTIALNTLVVMEIFHLFFIRNLYGTSLTWKAVRGTKVVWTTVILVTAAQFAIIEIEEQLRLRILAMRAS